MHKRKHYPALDGLRGIGFMIVFAAHFGQAYKSFYIAGKVGVGLFFVLSGFFLMQYFFHSFGTMTTWRHWATYIQRRVLRLYPMYLVVLFAEYFLGRYSLSTVASHLLLVDGRQHYWTLPVEFQFYAVMPLVAYICITVFKNKYAHCAVFFAILLTLTGIWYEPITSPFKAPLASQINLFFYLPAFVVGVILAYIIKAYEEGRFSIPKPTTYVLSCGSIGALVLLFSTSFKIFWAAGTSQALFWLFTGYSALWSVLVFSLISHPSFLSGILEHRLFRYLGAISYSAYLMHILVIAGVQAFLPTDRYMGFALSLFATLALSSITYHSIEKPALQFGIMRL